MAANVWLDIDDDVSVAGLPTQADCQRYIGAVLAALNISQPCSVDIRVVGINEGRALNAQYRDKDYATNVLSFAAELPEALLAELDERPLGDLAICAAVVAREADEQGKPLAAHWICSAMIILRLRMRRAWSPWSARYYRRWASITRMMTRLWKRGI